MNLDSTVFLAETRISEVTAEYYVETQAVDGISAWWMLIPLALIAVVYGIYNWLRNRPPLSSTPRGMLIELCNAHGITTSDRTLLERISEAAGFEHPSTMFLSSSNLDAAVDCAKSSLGLSQRQRKTLTFIRRQLFERSAGFPERIG